jgi:uncharacterized membrane protein
VKCLVTAFFFMLFGTFANSQSLPERYMVADVASDDVLNIRDEPAASSEIIGELGPYTLNVEVLRTLDGWGYVGAGERSGWVSMRFLVPNPPPENEIPRPMSCFGTEPFWNVSFYPRGAEYNAMGEARRDLTILREGVADNGYIVEVQEGPALTRTIIINALPCSDGMSDRNFGMSMSMFIQTPDGNDLRTGCCTMQVN